MAAITCLHIVPTEAVYDACTALTPIVEPAGDRVFMDWSGCGPVPRLAEQLAERLHSLGMSDRLNGANYSDNIDGDNRSVHPSTYRIGVASVRFVADILATAGDQIDELIANTSKRPAPTSGVTKLAGGYSVDEQALPAFIEALPIALLPEIEPETKETLSALAVNTLGELRRVRPDLLRSHIGVVADTLRSWAHGHDARPVSALYPPERLRQRIPGEAVAMASEASGGNLRTIVIAAATTLAAKLQETGRAMAELTVVGAGRRQTHAFTPPLTDADQIARTAWHMTNQLLTAAVGARDTPEHTVEDDPRARDVSQGELTAQDILSDAPHDAPRVLPTLGDLLLEIVPADSEGKQMSLWDQSRRGARANAALDAVRTRFRHIIRPVAPREAVTRYEAMFRSFELNG